MHYILNVSTSSKQKLQSQCLDFIQGKMYLHCTKKSDFWYHTSFSQKHMIKFVLPFFVYDFLSSEQTRKYRQNGFQLLQFSGCSNDKYPCIPLPYKFQKYILNWYVFVVTMETTFIYFLHSKTAFLGVVLFKMIYAMILSEILIKYIFYSFENMP